MKDGFEKGLLYAVTWLVEYEDQPTMAKELLETSGLDIHDVKNMDIDKKDKQILERLFSGATS